MTGTEAIRRLRLCRQQETAFGIVFVSVTEGAVRKIEQCQLRAAPSDKSFSDPDRFLYFTDLSTGEARQCRKRLIRQIRIHDQWHRVEWFR